MGASHSTCRTCSSWGGRAIGIELFGYMALKYTAAELCCACKPYLLRYVIATGRHRKILYLDTDMYVFGRLDRMLDRLDEASLVVIPHTLAPLPHPDRFHDRPRFGDLIAAGTYNAGMFGMSVGPDTVRFVESWAELVAAPGAFLPEPGSQHEQHFFNWLVGLADGVSVLKDTAYNVAYWNLHDRSLRYAGWDKPIEEAAWQVDGKPLVSFHFSGFSLEEPRLLSSHDSRHQLYHQPSLAKLCEFYVDQLFAHGAVESWAMPYRYDHFPSGLRVTPFVRGLFKRYEPSLWRPLDPWTDAGERHYGRALFLPLPETASLLPLALFEIYQARPTLQQAFPGAHLDPTPMVSWFSVGGREEDPLLGAYFDRYRPTIPTRTGIEAVVRARQQYPTVFAGLAEPLGADRSALLTRLGEGGLEPLAARVRGLEFEFLALSPIFLLWRLVERRPDLQATFPDVLDADAPAFAEWIRIQGPDDFLQPELADVFRQRAQGRSLARIFSFLDRTWDLTSQ